MRYYYPDGNLIEAKSEEEQKLLFIDYYSHFYYYINRNHYLENISAEKSWSTMDIEDYKKLRESLGEEKDFLWEMESWGEFAKEYKIYAKDSYGAYILERSMQ